MMCESPRMEGGGGVVTKNPKTRTLGSSSQVSRTSSSPQVTTVRPESGKVTALTKEKTTVPPAFSGISASIRGVSASQLFNHLATELQSMVEDLYRALLPESLEAGYQLRGAATHIPPSLPWHSPSWGSLCITSRARGERHVQVG